MTRDEMGCGQTRIKLQIFLNQNFDNNEMEVCFWVRVGKWGYAMKLWIYIFLVFVKCICTKICSILFIKI